ncbi:MULTISPECIES: hypothetical protein [Bacteroides]|uniref:Porin n=2 Tax=Bacteroidaceae TaxID=815 RepID=A0ABT7VJ53_9BACE|nr:MULTISPECIES: hypothetical protein [Bacteroides]MBU3856700.1 hypothetical protein [Candidatus Phocaeicola excrementipullorum]MBW9200760.1 hypothetical protein [Bacteroidales bacterium SW299]MCR8918800.1 hypothetical protein [Bacteroides sp. ET225]MDM8207317.1 hypothetical protein [Bacteroides gallinaceum]MDM8326303.1 hypothetical protein [Bacteroides gallinaceum]
MKGKVFLFSLILAACYAHAFAAGESANNHSDAADEKQEQPAKKKSRFTIGGYGEAAYSRNFFSDNYLRYTDAEKYRNSNSKHGRFDLPHVVLFFGYDFGKGWTMGTEIEFEHGGTESAVEIEDEEGGEYESEIERGGEVALEQFWIQKSFCRQFNIKIGHMIVPVGGTNMHHTPTEFFGVYRPAGENTILPCTWHETGVSIWGQAGDWRYEAMLMPGLDSDRFGRENWIKDGAASPYEFKIGNSIAGAFRIDNFSVPGLRLSLSGYVGNSFNNHLTEPKAGYKDIKGTVGIGAFDFHYNAHNWVVRGNFDYGHLSDADAITAVNKKYRDDAPSPKQNVASDAIAGGIEAGYDIFSQISKMRQKEQKFYVFARYDYYDSMHKMAGNVLKYDWCSRHRIAAGINYYPMKEIVIKGEYAIGLLKKQYNNEPALSFGIAYAGLFNL